MVLQGLRTSLGFGYCRDACWISFETGLEFAVGYAIRGRDGCVGHCGSWAQATDAPRVDGGLWLHCRSNGWDGRRAGIHPIRQPQNSGFRSGRSCRRYADWEAGINPTSVVSSCKGASQNQTRQPLSGATIGRGKPTQPMDGLIGQYNCRRPGTRRVGSASACCVAFGTEALTRNDASQGRVSLPDLP